MPKSSSSTNIDDPELLAPRMARDEIENDEPTKSQLKRAAAAELPQVTATPVAPPPLPPPTYAPPPPPPPGVAVIDTSGGMGNVMMNQQNFQQSQLTAQTQAQASVGLAQTNIDQQIVNEQIKKEDEHWMKSYWRPAMGWLYMIICFMDFVGFPLLTIFLPVIFKPFGLTVPYQTWNSLTLSNGGLFHLAMGAILGVAAFTRGQEKLAATR
jgi:hypothetical protein